MFVKDFSFNIELDHKRKREILLHLGCLWKSQDAQREG